MKKLLRTHWFAIVLVIFGYATWLSAAIGDIRNGKLSWWGLYGFCGIAVTTLFFVLVLISPIVYRRSSKPFYKVTFPGIEAPKILIESVETVTPISP